MVFVPYGGSPSDYAVLAGRNVPGQAYHVWQNEAATTPVSVGTILDTGHTPYANDQPVSDSHGRLRFVRDQPDNGRTSLWLTAVGDPDNVTVRLDPGDLVDTFNGIGVIFGAIYAQTIEQAEDIDALEAAVSNFPGTYQALSGKGAPSGYAGLDAGSQIDPTAVPNHSAGLLTSGTVADARLPSTMAGKTLTTPTIASFVNATHTHQTAAGGGTLDGAAIAAGTVADARLPTTMAGKTLTTSTLSVLQQTTPSNPPAGSNLIYPKSDNKFYTKDPSGTELNLLTTSSTLNASNLTSGTVPSARLADPSVSVSRNSGTPTLAAVNTLVAVTWDTKVWEDNTTANSMCNLSAPTRLVAPITGKYTLYFSVRLLGSGATTQDVRARIVKNGAGNGSAGTSLYWATATNAATAVPVGDPTVSGAVELKLTAADYVEVFIRSSLLNHAFVVGQDLMNAQLVFRSS